MNYTSPRTQQLFCTVRLDIYNGTEEIEPLPIRSATGFFVAVPIVAGTDQSRIFLVSNKHVLVSGGRLVMHMIQKDKDTQKPRLGGKYPVEIDDLQNYVEISSKPSVDIAIIDVTDFLLEHRHDVYFKNIPLVQFSDFLAKWLDVGLDVTFVGYPDRLYDAENLMPILRKGTIASHPKVNFDGAPQFIIDAQVFPGSSGSPVFVRYGPTILEELIITREGEPSTPANYHTEMELAGVLSAVILKGGKLVSVSSEEEEKQSANASLGLGVVFKATEIYEMIIESMVKYQEKVVQESFLSIGAGPFIPANVEEYRKALIAYIKRITLNEK